MPVLRMDSNSQRAQTGDVSGVLGHVEAHADVALRAQMIDFVRTDGGKQIHDLTGNGEIPEVQKLISHSGHENRYR